MKKFFIHMAILVLCILVSSCGEKAGNIHPPKLAELSGQEGSATLHKWYASKSNPYRSKKEMAGFEISVIQIPGLHRAVLNGMQERAAESTISQLELNISRGDFKDELLKWNLSSKNAYKERVEKCAFQMKKHCKLVCRDTAIAAIECHWERTYGLTSDLKFQLIFPVSESNLSQYTLQYVDELFDLGPLNIPIKSFDPEAL